MMAVQFPTKGALLLGTLSQQELVRELVRLVDECEAFSVFRKRNAEELQKVRQLRHLLRDQADDLNKEYVRHNLGQKRLRLVDEWLKGAGRMTKVVSVLNMKGGVGKTTLTYNLAWYAAYKKAYKVLVVDLDPQSNLTQYFMGDDGYEEFLDQGKPSIVEIFEQGAKNAEGIIQVVSEWDDGSLIHLVPAKLELSKTLKNPTTKERRLARFLAGIKEEYDMVLIDCPPTDSILTVAAYLASDFVVIPVKPERLATIGLPLLAGAMEAFNEDNKGEHEIQVAGIIFNDVDPNEPPEERTSKKFVAKFAQQYNWKVFENPVRTSRAYVSGSRQGKPVFLTSRVRDYVMKEFYEVGDEFLGSVGLE